MNKQKSKPKPKQEPSELNTLVPEKKVGKYTVKPWSFGKLSELSPYIEQAIDLMIQKGITLKSVTDISKIHKLIFAIMPVAPAIVAITVGVDEEEAKEMQADVWPVMIMTIITQNMEYLKNLQSQLPGVVKAVVAG